MADTDYNFLSADPVRPISQTISQWQGVQKNALEIQQQQAAVEQGKALQGAIDPQTGEFDQSKYMRTLAANPVAARGALQAAQGGLTLSTGAYDLHSKRLDAANSAMAQLIADNPGGVPGDAMHAAIERQRSLGNLTDQEAQAEHAQVNSDPKANTRLLLQGLGHGLAVKTQLDAVKPATETADVGGRIVTLQKNPQMSTTGGPSVQIGSGVTTGPQPGPLATTTLPVDDQGVIPQDANGNLTRKPVGRLHWDPFQVPVQQAPGQPQGGQPVPAPAPQGPSFPPGYTGRGVPPPPNPSLANPANPAPASPTPATGPRSDIPSGVQVASADPNYMPSSVFLGATTAAPATAPSDAVAGDVAAIRTGMANAAGTAPGGTQTAQLGPYLRAGPPSGYTERQDNDIKIATEAATAMPALRDNLTATETALKALQLSHGFSGPTSGFQANVQAFLEANGLSPGDPTKMSDADWRQVAQKNLLRIAESQAGTRTNLGLETGLHANPNMDSLTTNANEHVLAYDIGRMRQRIAQTLEMPSADGQGSAAEHVKNFTNDTDFRGFAWDVMPKSERDAIEKEVAGNKAATARLDKALELANKWHLIQVPPSPKKQGSAAPPSSSPATPTNALAMATPSANALAA